MEHELAKRPTNLDPMFRQGGHMIKMLTLEKQKKVRVIIFSFLSETRMLWEVITDVMMDSPGVHSARLEQWPSYSTFLLSKVGDHQDALERVQ